MGVYNYLYCFMEVKNYLYYLLLFLENYGGLLSIPGDY